MRTYLIRVAYDGTNFSGYQVQRQGERTVQAVLERALLELHGHAVSTVVAGRTDSGVQFNVLAHNTIRGAAGASILNGELLAAEGWL